MRLRTKEGSKKRHDIIVYLKDVFEATHELFHERIMSFNRYCYTYNRDDYMTKREERAWNKFFRYLEKKIELYSGKFPNDWDEMYGVTQVDIGKSKEFMIYMMARLQVVKNTFQDRLFRLSSEDCFYASEGDSIFKLWDKYFFEIMMSVEADQCRLGGNLLFAIADTDIHEILKEYDPENYSM